MRVSKGEAGGGAGGGGAGTPLVLVAVEEAAVGVKTLWFERQTRAQLPTVIPGQYVPSVVVPPCAVALH